MLSLVLHNDFVLVYFLGSGYDDLVQDNCRLDSHESLLVEFGYSILLFQ